LPKKPYNFIYTFKYQTLPAKCKLAGVTIHRTGPHRPTPDRTGSHRTHTRPHRATGPVPGRKWLIISLWRRMKRRKTS